MARIRILLVCWLLLVPFPAQAQLAQPEQWRSTLYTDHPLVGRIWDSAANRFIDVPELIRRIEDASYLLLGEKHDNPDHHLLQLAIVEHLIANEALALLSLEMLESDDQERLDSIQQQDLSELDQIHSYLQWDDDGWDWEYYGPLIKAAFDARVPMAAANISSATMSRVYGEPSLPEVAGILDATTMERLNLDIDESHCGLLPESQFPAMVRVQQARDLAMARSLRAPPRGAVALLLAGNFHVRRDLGVPNYLLAQRPQTDAAEILSLSFMEVQPGEQDPAAYLQQFGQERAYDLIWFTPAISDEDYCASLQ